MTALQPIITTVGLQAILNASNDGWQAKLTHIALGDVGWQPDATATQLQQERQRIPISNGSRLQSSQLHITAVENGDQNYWVREIGLFLADGTLLAVWSDAEQALAWKSADVDLLLAFDLLLTALPVDSVVIDGSGGLELAPAAEQQRGIVRLATIEEAQQGQENTTAITPASCQAHGDSRYALIEHGHSWQVIEDKPVTYPATSHTHKKADVGLGNVPNYSATSSVTDDATNKLATAKAVKKAYDKAQSRALVWGGVQMTSYINDWEKMLDYTLPKDCVMVGLYSPYKSVSSNDRRWRIRYRKLTLK